MKIKDSREFVDISKIKDGEMFIHSERYYMKIRTIYTSDKGEPYKNVVDLSTGITHMFPKDGAYVHRAIGEVVIK